MRLRPLPHHLAATLCLALTAGIVLSLSPQPVAPQPPASPESLTQSLMSLSGQYQRAPRAQQPALLQQLLSVAAARQQRLAILVETDPGAVIRVAVPDAVRSGLPSQVQAYIEQEVREEGELEVLHEDRTTGSRYLYFLHTATERLALHFASDAPSLQTGARVRVHGYRLNGVLAAGSGSTSVQTLSTIAPNTFGAQQTLVILVNFQDNPTQPYTPSQAQGVVFTTTSNFYKENSSNQTWLVGDVAGWYTIPVSYTTCDYSSIASYARQAASAAGYNVSGYNRLVYAFPSASCSWWGLGTVGGNPSQAWVNGSFQLRVVGHEMGHNLGLYHSHALECGATVVGTGCSSIEYGDTLDIMGSAGSGHFNSFQKERLGWLSYSASPPITTVQSTGTYSIDAYETNGANPKALKILKSTDPTTGKKTWYYIEYRQAVGFDSFLSTNGNVLNGVVLHMGSESSSNSSYLLDLTPQTSSWSDPALDLGLSFTDPDSGMTLVPVSGNGTSASVSVTFAPTPCVRGTPQVALVPTQSQWVPGGTLVGYSVTVTNTDNSSCSASNFSLQPSAPSGWSAVLGTSSLSLGPGTSGSTTLAVTSPDSAADGFYPVSDSATNTAAPTYTATATATYVVASALWVSVSTDQATYTRNQRASITATVTAGGSPVSGASVTFTIAKANGTVVTGAGTTDASGRAVYKFRVKHQDPVGTYEVTVTASKGNTIFGTASTSFAVK